MGQEFWSNGGMPQNVNVTDALSMLGTVRDAGKTPTPALRGGTGIPGSGGKTGMVTPLQTALKMNNPAQAPQNYDAFGGFVQGGWGIPHDRLLRYTPQDGLLLAGSGPGAIPNPANNPYPANPQYPSTGPIRPVDTAPVTPPVGNGTITPPPGGGGTPPPAVTPPPSVVTPIGGGHPITPGGGGGGSGNTAGTGTGGWGPALTSIGSSEYPVWEGGVPPDSEAPTTSINGTQYQVNIPEGAGWETYLRTLIAAAGGGNGISNVTPEAAAANPALLAGYGQTPGWEDWMLGTISPIGGG